MARQLYQRQLASDKDAAQESSNDLPRRKLSNEQIDRLGQLIADDPNEFPNDFPAEELQALKTAVRRELQSRMVMFIAKAIAMDVRRIEGSEHEKES
jgi:hypothetical protein